MQIEKEFECKSLITKEKYKELLSYFNSLSLQTKSYIQVNHYFDSDNFILDNYNVTLRIRYKSNQWELTAKIKEAVQSSSSDSIELNQNITDEEARYYFSNGISSNNSIIIKVFEFLNVSNYSNYHFDYLGSLETLRNDYYLNDDIISIDKSNYINVTDYEIEWEYKDKETVLNKFLELGLVVGNSKGKKDRFLQEYKNYKGLS